MKKIISLGIIVTIFLCGCRPPVIYSDIPEIKFVLFKELNELEGFLVFTFQDGDGDIGLDEAETYPPFNLGSIYYHNLFCDYYEKQNGVFVKVDYIETDTGRFPFNFNARIPRLSYLPEESISGEISYTISPYFYDIFSPYNDTIQLKFYIVDRKLNHSNIEEVIVIRGKDSAQMTQMK